MVDQGFTYLSLMLQNKADFILEYNEQNPKDQLSRNNVDWSQSRVIFVSSDFTENQIEATNLKDIAIELYEVKRYGELLLIIPIQKSQGQKVLSLSLKRQRNLRVLPKKLKFIQKNAYWLINRRR